MPRFGLSLEETLQFLTDLGEPKPREEAAYIWDEGASKSETLVWEVKQKRNHNRTLLVRIIKMTNEKFEGVFDYKEGDTIPVAKCQPIKLQLKP